MSMSDKPTFKERIEKLREAYEEIEDARTSLGDIAQTVHGNIEAMEVTAKRYEARNAKKAESK